MSLDPVYQAVDDERILRLENDVEIKYRSLLLRLFLPQCDN